MTDPTMNATGLVAGILNGLFYPPMYVWDPAANTSCRMGAHGPTMPIAINDRGEVLYSQVHSIPPGFSEFRVTPFVTGDTACGRAITVAESTDGNRLRTINNGRVVAGLVNGVASAGIVGTSDFLSLDGVLKASGNGAEDWHVIDVERVTNTNVFVATAQRAGGEPQLVLLVPVAR